MGVRHGLGSVPKQKEDFDKDMKLGEIEGPRFSFQITVKMDYDGGTNISYRLTISQQQGRLRWTGVPLPFPASFKRMQPARAWASCRGESQPRLLPTPADHGLSVVLNSASEEQSV